MKYLIKNGKSILNRKWDIGWGYISECNMKCEFCYSKDARHNINPIDLKVAQKFVNDNADVINSINYGTGENALSDEWFQLIRYIRENFPQIRQSLTTNGSIAKVIENNNMKYNIFSKAIDEIDISLDFCDSSRHNEFRGNSTAYQMAHQTLQLCKDLNKQRTIVFLGTNEVLQANNIEGIFEVADKYNAYLRCNIYRPASAIVGKTEKYILSYSRLMTFLQWVSEKHRIIKLSDCLLAAVLFNEGIPDYTGVSSLRILGDGSITPSTYLIDNKYRVSNIKNGIDLSSLKFENISNEKIPKKCMSCICVDKCKGGVIDRRLLWYGTLDERDPYCPYRHNDLKKYDIKYKGEESFQSVHDSYLPTMFFKP